MNGIRQRGDHWEVVVSAGVDPVTGKRKRLYSAAKTEKAAVRLHAQLLAKVDAGQVADSGRLTVNRYVAEHWLPHAETRVRPRTFRRYEELLNAHVLPAIGNVKLAKLRPLHVQKVVDAMTAAGRAPATTIQAYRVLHSALGQCVRWQMLSTNPAAAVRPPRKRRTHLTVPSVAETRAILAAAGAEDWFGVTVHLAVHTGLRRGEVLALAWSDVDLDDGTVRVHRALETHGPAVSVVGTKSGRGRTVVLPGTTLEALHGWRAAQLERRLLLGPAWEDSGLVIDRGDGRLVHPDTLTHRFAKLVERLGIPQVRFHDLRHGFATRCLEAGLSPKVVSEALGHSSVAFTLDTYSHVLPSMQGQTAAAMAAALGDRG
jgi:integrase